MTMMTIGQNMDHTTATVITFSLMGLAVLWFLSIWKQQKETGKPVSIQIIPEKKPTEEGTPGKKGGSILPYIVVAGLAIFVYTSGGIQEALWNAQRITETLIH